VDLILVRHGEAESAGPMQTDADRRLTAVGERAAARTGRKLAELGLPRPRIVASPKVRAFETARILARELSVDPPSAIPALRGDDDPDQILAALAKQKSTCLIAVGHMPDLGKLAVRLMDPSVSGAVAIPTAGYVWLELDGLPPREPARLRRFE
jgi:phosphohistidine phosphatase